MVFENGKEVFRMLPANAEHRLDTRGQNSQDPNKVATLDANDANARLIFRVEPEYPADAIVASLKPHALSLTFVPVADHAHHDPDALAQRFGGRSADGLEDALAGLPSPRLIAGSLYLAGEALSGNGETPD